LCNLCNSNDTYFASRFTNHRNRIHRNCIGVEAMTIFWIATIGTSVIAFLLKYSGHSVPERWLSHPKIQNINALIPIALLSALVAVQSFSEKSQLMIDQRLVGLLAAIIALIFKAPFPIVVLSAAVSSAAVYNWL
jgi:hypothetical protein